MLFTSMYTGFLVVRLPRSCTCGLTRFDSDGPAEDGPQSISGLAVVRSTVQILPIVVRPGSDGDKEVRKVRLIQINLFAKISSLYKNNQI